MRSIIKLAVLVLLVSSLIVLAMYFGGLMLFGPTDYIRTLTQTLDTAKYSVKIYQAGHATVPNTTLVEVVPKQGFMHDARLILSVPDYYDSVSIFPIDEDSCYFGFWDSGHVLVGYHTSLSRALGSDPSKTFGRLTTLPIDDGVAHCPDINYGMSVDYVVAFGTYFANILSSSDSSATYARALVAHNEGDSIRFRFVDRGCRKFVGEEEQEYRRLLQSDSLWTLLTGELPPRSTSEVQYLLEHSPSSGDVEVYHSSR